MASGTSAAAAAARLPGRRCACVGAGAVRRTYRNACRSKTAGRRPSTSTRTAADWPRRPGRRAERGRTPRPSCDGAVVDAARLVVAAAVGGAPPRPLTTSDGDATATRKQPTSWDWPHRTECNRPGTQRRKVTRLAGATVCRRPLADARQVGTPRSKGHGTTGTAPRHPVGSRGSSAASSTPPCDGDGAGETAFVVDGVGDAVTDNPRRPSRLPPRRRTQTTRTVCGAVGRVTSGRRPPVISGWTRSLCCCNGRRWPRTALSF